MSLLAKIEAWVGTFGSSLDKVADVAHFEAGFISGATLGLTGALIVCVPWGVTKEAYIDPKWEDAPFFWNGAIDLAFYVGGAMAGVLYHWARFGEVWI